MWTKSRIAEVTERPPMSMICWPSFQRGGVPQDLGDGDVRVDIDDHRPPPAP
jgi:hypothetical protein